MIGASLSYALGQSGQTILGTTRREQTITNHRLFLNLAEAPFEWEPPDNINVAYFCAGETSL